MHADLGFRLSGYLLLALACAALAHAEQLFMSSSYWLLLPALALLAVAFFLEGRWVMPIWLANVLGLLIAGTVLVWAASSLSGGAADSPGIPWVVRVLPYLGPVLTVLLLAKLLLRKQITDIWVVQGMGLLQVALSCVLANDWLFGVLLFAYLASAAWFLAQFSLYREQLASLPVRDAPAGAGPRGLGLGRAVRWTLPALVAALALFLLLPRHHRNTWDALGSLRAASWYRPTGMQTGVTDGIDLNRVGKVELTDELVLEVRVSGPDGTPGPELGGDQRWRAAVLEHYVNGRWLSRHPTQFRYLRLAEMAPEAFPPDWQPLADQLPNLGPRQFFLSYEFPQGPVGGLPLAEPIVPHPRRRTPPVVTRREEDRPHLRFTEQDSTLLLSHYRISPDFGYQQVTVRLAEPDVGVPVRLSRERLADLRRQPVPSLTAWTKLLLERLLANPVYKLTPEDLEFVGTGEERALDPERHEKVARALASYLAHSGDYTYSLRLRRDDRRMDPTEDFLVNVRQGHCERYAAALALMLRALGIPARVVKGYHGGEPLGDGRYLVRHRDAHGWVEALVLRPVADGEPEYHWLTLDPTPSESTAEEEPITLAGLWETSRHLGLTFWKDYIVDYDAERQQVLVDEGWTLLASAPWRRLAGRLAWPAAAVGLGLAVLAAWRLRRRLRRPFQREAAALEIGDGYYGRLREILARRCQLRTQPAQTPREFARGAAHWLLSHGAADLAEVPAEVSDALYRVRYGREELTPDEHRRLNDGLQRLDNTLAAGGSRQPVEGVKGTSV
jgi:transglutaminase-like putative cysteine protease